ncbi:hypothetical protein PRIPAC_79642 [Pristionchus pacificus]|uniref:Uncharacterized protein n=1 Tax=Pristionchus pacificus TaxID=54126 RepID=A0A2A6BXE4_PRIPA|nr:hypothetical protein PRIPAC_79642 [Pristionchus pacificus]|eukprot:PDM70584.1 hypothetical protein PRIPAC_46830 [Pristionchus pacificus]
MILEYAPEKVLDMRLTSFKLNAHVNEYARNTGMKLPLGIGRGDKMRLEILMYCANLSFGERWLDDCIKLLQHISMCTRIRALETDVLESPAVQLLLNGKRIRSLTIANSLLSKTVQDRLMKTITVGGTEKLILSVGRIENPEPDAFLASLSTIVYSLKIQQLERQEKEVNSLLGIRNADVVPIILKMFSNKLCKLEIEDHFHPRYMNSGSIDRLVKARFLIKNMLIDKIRFSGTSIDGKKSCGFVRMYLTQHQLKKSRSTILLKLERSWSERCKKLRVYPISSDLGSPSTNF